MTQTTEERIATIINEGVTGECDGAITGQMSTAQIIAAEIDNLRERNAFLLASAEAAQAKLAEARAEVEAKDKRIAELEQLAALSPIKLGDISITLGLAETGEARMIFDGADDATLAVVAAKFAAAMRDAMDGAK